MTPEIIQNCGNAVFQWEGRGPATRDNFSNNWKILFSSLKSIFIQNFIPDFFGRWCTFGVAQFFKYIICQMNNSDCWNYVYTVFSYFWFTARMCATRLRVKFPYHVLNGARVSQTNLISILWINESNRSTAQRKVQIYRDIVHNGILFLFVCYFLNNDLVFCRPDWVQKSK